MKEILRKSNFVFPPTCGSNWLLTKTDETRQLIAMRRLHPTKLTILYEGGNLNFPNTCFLVWRNLVSQNRRNASADILWLAFRPAFLASCLTLLCFKRSHWSTPDILTSFSKRYLSRLSGRAVTEKFYRWHNFMPFLRNLRTFCVISYTASVYLRTYCENFALTA